MDAFAWPIAVTVIALFALIFFRKELSRLLERTKEVGTGGLKTYENPPPQPVEEKRAVEDFFRTFDNPLLLEAEDLILKDLRDRKIESHQEREKTLIRALASTNLTLLFERVHGSIWASQLTALRFLNPRDSGVERSDLLPFYDAAKAEYPNWYEHHTFERWLEYLESFNLIGRKDSRIFIAVAGREFLKYLIASGKSGPFYG